MRIPNGDLLLARDYLERVAGSNAEDVGRASELLKTVKETIQAKMRAEAEAQAQVIQDSTNITAESVGEELVSDVSIIP